MAIDHSSHEMDLDGFITHSGSSSGAGFLERWRDDGEIDVWLHPKAGVAAVWSHSWPRVDPGRAKDGKPATPRVRTSRFNCIEREAVLKKQRYRIDETDAREFPPLTCPLCRTIEWVRAQIHAKRLSWVEPLFSFDAGDPEADPTVILAGGWCGLFQKAKEKYSHDELVELKRAGVARDEAFMMNGYARLQYLLRVIPHADPGEAAVLAYEAQALGDKLKKVIRTRMEDLKEKGDPRTYPVAFRWKYDENENFSDRYDVLAVTSLAITPEVRAAMDAAPPSIEEQLAPGNVRLLRASMEEHCLIQGVPWDELFGPAERALDEQAGDEPAEEGDDGGYLARDPAPSKSVSAPTPAPPGDDDSMVACDACGTAMPVTEFDCPKCGAKYDPESGALATRPCVFETCRADVPVGKPGEKAICPKCGAIHEPDWTVRERPAPAPPLATRSAVAGARKPMRQIAREKGGKG